MVNILVAEDDRDHFQLLEEAIENTLPRYQINHSRDGKELLQKLEELSAPDMIFLDLNMPKKNGLDCLVEIRQRKELQSTPIVIYSTSSDFEDIDLCYKNGCTLYLVKPPFFKDLLAQIKKLFSHELAEEALRKSEETYRTQLENEVEIRTAELKAINTDLRYANENLQQFASIASHDLQEPLRKIQIFSNLLKEREETLTPEARKNLQKIIDSSARMKTLIIEILHYSKLSANDTHWECVDLSEIIAELREDFELIVEEKKATIQAANLPCLDVNRGQIRQVFQNIVSNALKFARVGVPSVIQINAKRIGEKNFSAPEQTDGPFCLISIEDNGIGFNQKYVENIFYLFERLNSKNQYEGTGIGLAIAKKIIEKHDGLITATGSEGKGATFQIILPLSQTK